MYAGGAFPQASQSIRSSETARRLTSRTVGRAFLLDTLDIAIIFVVVIIVVFCSVPGCFKAYLILFITIVIYNHVLINNIYKL